MTDTRPELTITLAAGQAGAAFSASPENSVHEGFITREQDRGSGHLKWGSPDQQDGQSPMVIVAVGLAVACPRMARGRCAGRLAAPGRSCGALGVRVEVPVRRVLDGVKVEQRRLSLDSPGSPARSASRSRRTTAPGVTQTPNLFCAPCLLMPSSRPMSSQVAPSLRASSTVARMNPPASAAMSAPSWRRSSVSE